MSSIRQRLTRKLLLRLCLLLGCGLTVVYFAVRSALVAEFDSTLQAKAQAVSSVTLWGESGVVVDFTDKFMQGFDDKVATDFFEMWQSDGKVIERSESLGAGDLPRRAATASGAQYVNLRLPSGKPGRAVTFRFTPETEANYGRPEQAPVIELSVASDRGDLNKTLFVLLAVIGSCGLVLLVATLALVPQALQTELRPLDRLADQVAQIDARSLANRFATSELPSELLPITGKLNELLGRLQQSFERERRFSADLAHELRTPLAELCGLAEYAVEWPESRDPTTDQEVLAVGRQMEGLVNRMLTLARSERGEMSVALESVALRPLIESLWRRYAEKAAKKNLSVQLQLEPITVESDPVLIRAILGNLFDNAVEYTPEGGELVVELKAEQAIVTLSVSNTVEDFEPGDVAKLFDRFWRKESSRTGGSHAGLGLNLSREFARALGWELTATFTSENKLSLKLTQSAPVGQRT